MVSINVTEFRKNLQRYLSSVQSGQTVHLTRRGKVIAHLAPPGDTQERAREKLLELRPRAVVGDVVSPVDDMWEADRAPS